MRNGRKFANRHRPLQIQDYSYNKHALHVLLCLYTSFLMFLHNWKAYHIPVYQDIARKYFRPRVHLHLRCVNLGPVRSVWPTKKKVCMGGKSGVRIENCLVADASRFRGGACRKMQGMSTYLLRWSLPSPLLPNAAIAVSLLGNLQIDIQISRRPPYRHAGVACPSHV